MDTPKTFKIDDTGEILPTGDFLVDQSNSNLIERYQKQGKYSTDILTSYQTPCLLYNPSLRTGGKEKLVGVNLGSCFDRYQTIISEDLLDFEKPDYFIEYMGKAKELKAIFKIPIHIKTDFYQINKIRGKSIIEQLAVTKDCSKIIFKKYQDIENYIKDDFCSSRGYRLVRENGLEKLSAVRKKISIPAIEKFKETLQL